MHFSADGKDPMESGISEVGERGYFPKQEHFLVWYSKAVAGREAWKEDHPFPHGRRQDRKGLRVCGFANGVWGSSWFLQRAHVSVRP